MRNRLLAVLSLLLIASMVLTACGGGAATEAAPAAPATEEATATEAAAATEEATATEAAAATEEATATEEAAATEAAATEAAAASGEVVTVNYLGGYPSPGTTFDKGLVDEWNAANPDIQVNYIEGPESATDRYAQHLQLFEAQSPDIDVMQIDVIWPGDLAEHLIDFNEYGGAEAVADDFPAIVTNNTVDGRLVGLPWFTDGGLLYSRTDLLEKYGYTAPPATWDELEEMANTIQEGERAEGNQDFWGFVWQGKAYEGLTCDALEWIYSNGGGTIVSPEKIITINNEAASSALDRAAGWVGTISPDGVTGFMEEDSRAVFQGGNAAFMRNWPYAYSLAQADDSPVKGNVQVGPLPGAEAGMSAATLGGWQLGVSKYSAHPAEAAKFALWMASTEIQQRRAIANTNIPTKQSLYEDPEIAKAYPWMPGLLPVFTSAVARPSTATAPQYNEVSTIFFSNVAQVLTGEQSGEDAVANIELDLQDLLGFEVGAPN
jgi:trehalose/maltose transport system substrate-binding protein